MIIYSKTLWGIPLLTRVYGSALPRSLAPAVCSGLITTALLLLGDRVNHLWSHPYAYQPFVLLVSFVLTFRSNYAYQRHWEAYTQMQTMSARWLDAAMQIIMFDKHPLLPAEPSHAPAQASQGCATSLSTASSHAAFVAELVHLISLLHGVSCAALRRDADVANLSRHSRLMEAPPSDPALLDKTTLQQHSNSTTAGGGGSGSDDGRGVAGGSLTKLASYLPHMYGDVNIVGAANWRDIFMLRGSSSTIRKYNAAQPLPIVGGVSPQELAALGCRLETSHGAEPDEDKDTGYWGGKAAGRWRKKARAAPGGRTTGGATNTTSRASSSGLWGMLRLRQPQQDLKQHTPQAQQRQQQQKDGITWQRSHSFSEGLCDQQQGCASSAQASPQPPADVRLRRSNSGLAGDGVSGLSGLSGPHVRLGGAAVRPLLKRSLTRRFRVSLNHTCCGSHLPYMDRPMLVLAWLHELLLQRQEAGGLRVAAPILARVHTCLSEGIHGFEQCRKLADTPFPFPWAQFVLVMLVIFTGTLPLLVLAYVQNSGLAIAVTVITVATYWAVNEVARDVEDPFIMDPNNMPLANGQYHFNELLLTLSGAERPASGVLPAAMGLRVGSAMPATFGAWPGSSSKQQQPEPPAAAAGVGGRGARAAAAAAGAPFGDEVCGVAPPASSIPGESNLDRPATSAVAGGDVACKQPPASQDNGSGSSCASATEVLPDASPVESQGGGSGGGGAVVACDDDCSSARDAGNSNITPPPPAAAAAAGGPQCSHDGGAGTAAAAAAGKDAVRRGTSAGAASSGSSGGSGSYGAWQGRSGNDVGDMV